MKIAKMEQINLLTDSDTFESDLERFFNGYEAALYWSATDEINGETVNFDSGDYPTSTQADDRCRADCRAFFGKHYAWVQAAAARYPTQSTYGGLELAGHDFALTRNRHGAGFWDRGLGSLGLKLTEAAEAAGECWPYLVDGELWIR